jgi:hypothetical protein
MVKIKRIRKFLLGVLFIIIAFLLPEHSEFCKNELINQGAFIGGICLGLMTMTVAIFEK